MKIQLVRKEAKIPVKQHISDTGYDIFCPLPEVSLPPGETRVIWCGFKLEIPPNHWGAVCSRSGLASKGIFVTNAPGVIDSGYREEVGVILTNSSDVIKTFKLGDRIAQLIILPCVSVEFEEGIVGESDRKGGLGYTGA